MDTNSVLPPPGPLEGSHHWLLTILPLHSPLTCTMGYNKVRLFFFLTGFCGLVSGSASCFAVVRRAPALTLYERVFLSLSHHACTLYSMLSLDPSVVGLAPPCTCWKKDTITRFCASHTCVTWSAKSLSFFPSCILESSFLSLVYKSLSTTDPRLPTTKF